MANALVIIDMQNYYMNDFTEDLPAKILEYLEENTYDFVLCTRFINNEQTNLVKSMNWKKMFSGIETQVVDSLASLKLPVFKKSTYSVFKSKDFLDFIQENEIDSFNFCGIATDACVLASMFDGFDLGYKVKTISSLTLSHGGKSFTECGLKIINRNLQRE